MATLLERPLDSSERMLRESIRKILPMVPQTTFSEALWRSLGLTGPAAYFSAILSLLQFPPKSSLERELYAHILAIPDFYVYLADPNSFTRPALVNLGRTLLRIEPRFDVKMISALAEDNTVDRETFVRALSVLDEMSPGGRITMTLARVQRDADPEVASKVTMLLGRRVSNPHFVERHLASPVARTRANIIETLWGVDSKKARQWLLKALDDRNDRVVGNALVGLHLLKDARADSQVRAMATHEEPLFRATAAWAMEKMGKASFRAVLNQLLADPDRGVRDAAERALAAIPQEVVEQAAPPHPAAAVSPEPAAENEKPAGAEDEFGLRLDGGFHRRVYRR